MNALAWMLFFGLVLLAAAQLRWGLKHKSRLWQYPTLASFVWLFYMLPMAYGSLKNPDKLPSLVIEDGGYLIALSMCVASLACGWLGWTQGLITSQSADYKISKAAETQLNQIFLYGAVVSAIGLVAAFLMARHFGGFAEQFAGGAYYDTEWTGPIVKYKLFINFLEPALLLCFLVVARHPTVFKVTFTLLVAIYPLCTVVFLGRRSVAAFLVLAVVFALYFVRRISMSRWLYVSLCLAGGLAIILAPAYRSSMAFSGNLEESLRGLEVEQSVKQTLRGEHYSEFDALVVGAAYIQKTKRFDFGTGLYNGLVQCAVPRQVVGEPAKQRLLISLHRGRIDSMESVYGWEIPYGSNPTGPLQAFTEFWFFGAAMYFGFSWFLARVWNSAVRGSIVHQMAYGLLLPSALAAVAGAWHIVPTAVLFTYAFILPVIFILRQSPRVRTRAQRTPAKVDRRQNEDTPVAS